MSYNTRRQGGVGRGTSQVMYHQQQNVPPRSSGPVRSGPPQSQNTPGYSSGYSSQPGGYQSGGNQGYSSQQYQAQQQVVPPPPPPPMSVQQSPAPKPLHGILKTETTSPAQQPPVKAPPSPAGAGEPVIDVDRSEEVVDEGKPRPPWMKKKQFGFKVNKTLKRRRQNARLRKLLQPKNAIMVLNELVTGVKFTISEHANALSQLMYQVSTEIESKVYTGQALSKIMAKQSCAENALKAIILEKLSKSPVKIDPPSQSERTEENNGAVGMSDGEENVTSDKNMDVDDDVPWKSLTSFAIYKLFLEWQNEGTPVPFTTPSKSSALTGQLSEERSPKPMKKVPDNPTDRHPVMLLNHMRPGLQFVEVSRSGNPPETMFTMEVVVDGKPYSGTGKNKKEAKKEAAKEALANVLDIHYP